MNNNKKYSVVTHASDGRRYLAEGESLRGLAIVLVVIFHLLAKLDGIEAQPQLPWYQSIWYAGNTGVTLFFVLSGFLLVQPFLSGRPYSIANFYWNRALRILPLYWLMVLAGGLYHQQLGEAAAIAAFINASNMTTLPPFGGVWWSLAIEVQFYLLLPLVIGFLRAAPRWAWLIAIGGVLVPAYFWVATADIQDSVHGARNNIIGRWPAFACGMAAAWLHARRDRLPRLQGPARRLAGDVLLVAPLIGLALIADRITTHYGFMAHGYWYHHYAIEAVLWSVFLLAMLIYPSRIKHLFDNPLLHRLGVWSYSIYLLHMPLLYVATKLADAWLPNWKDQHLLLVVASYLAMTALVSALSYRYIELPFLRLKRPTSVAATAIAAPAPGLG